MENSVYRGISHEDHRKLNPKFSHWYSFCEEWISLTEKCSRLLDGDSSYSHNEQGNVALLSAAIFRAGWIAMSETLIEKAGNFRLGRGDLYITNEIHDEAIETKICWLNIERNHINQIEDKHKFAVKDVRNIDSEQYSSRIAITFVVPWYEKSYPESYKIEKTKNLQNSITTARLSSKNMIVAWCFPDFKDRIEDKDGNLFHGVIIIVEKV
jgi:hypothetical protein